MGHPESMLLAGIDCETADQTSIGLNKANYWYRKAVEHGITAAKWHLGVNYLGVKGGERNTDEAVRLLTDAASEDHEMAMWTLGMLYLKGAGLVDKDAHRGLELLEQAAEKGHARSCEHLAEIFSEGLHGFDVDHERADKWARMVEELDQSEDAVNTVSA